MDERAILIRFHFIELIRRKCMSAGEWTELKEIEKF